LSKWVGESEQNVRSLFDNFKKIRKKTKTDPILLLNEADQFLSTRTNSTSGSDKMHNQMQNIFLEQIERFDGILIATTNLLQNIDTAFSRRFNYKIKFTMPDEQSRAKIWQKLLPPNIPLEDGFDIQELAPFQLTGGQIELVIKNTAYKVATQKKPLFTIKQFKQQIKIEQNSMFDGTKSMGFLS
jgi:SpoVK/Ycf46/Vps4 family AAA+-type ATPase